MVIREHTLTEFLQHSGRVLAEVPRGGVVLHRRDGEDLFLMTRGQSEALGETMRALAAVVLSGPAHLTTVFPELAFLSTSDREECLRELSEVASAAIASGEIGRLEVTLDQWKATGLAAWDERRLRERDDHASYVIDEPAALERPHG